MAKEKDSKVKNDNKYFMKDVKAELKKVVWPTSKQMASNLTTVLTIVLVTAVIVFCLDFVFGTINEFGTNKLEKYVQSRNQVETEIVDEITTDDVSETDTENSDIEENNEEESTEITGDAEDAESTSND